MDETQTGPLDRATAAEYASWFRVVGTRERIACHHGRWRDVLLIERRSRVAGAS